MRKNHALTNQCQVFEFQSRDLWGCIWVGSEWEEVQRLGEDDWGLTRRSEGIHGELELGGGGGEWRRELVVVQDRGRGWEDEGGGRSRWNVHDPQIPDKDLAAASSPPRNILCKWILFTLTEIVMSQPTDKYPRVKYEYLWRCFRLKYGRRMLKSK